MIFSTDCTDAEIKAYLKNTNRHTVSELSSNDYIYDATKKVKIKVIYSFPYASVVNADDQSDVIFRHELTKNQYEAIVGEGGSSSGIGENFTSVTENLTIIPYVSEKDGVTRYSVIVFTDFRNRKCVAFVVRGDFTSNDDNKIFNNLSVNGYFAFDEKGKKCVKGTESTSNKVPILYETIVYSKG